MLWTPKSADRDGRRIWPENLDFVRLPATVVGSIPAKRPGTAPFPPRAFMDPGSLESGWWWTQSRANPSPANSLLNRELTGNFRGITPYLARSGPLTHWYNSSFGSNSLNIGTGNIFTGTGNFFGGTGNYLAGSGNRRTVRRRRGDAVRRHLCQFYAPDSKEGRSQQIGGSRSPICLTEGDHRRHMMMPRDTDLYWTRPLNVHRGDQSPVYQASTLWRSH